jgi:hypothetical protein
MLIFEAVTRKARKQHTCMYCGQFIRRGAHYKQWACVDDGTVTTCRAHMECASVDWDCDDDGIEPGTGWRGVDFPQSYAHRNEEYDGILDWENYPDPYAGDQFFTREEDLPWECLYWDRIHRAILHRFMTWVWSLPVPMSALDAGRILEGCRAACDELPIGRIDTEDKTAFWEMLTGYDHPTQPNTTE